jgi:hypothetical protein
METGTYGKNCPKSKQMKVNEKAPQQYPIEFRCRQEGLVAQQMRTWGSG